MVLSKQPFSLRWATVLATIVVVFLTNPMCTNASFEKGIQACRDLQFENGMQAFQAELGKNASHSGALHSMATLLFVYAQTDKAYEYYQQAIQAQPGSLPPLALLYQDGEDFSGTGEAFWVATFALRSMHEYEEQNRARPKTQPPGGEEGGPGGEEAARAAAGAAARRAVDHLSLGLLLEGCGLADAARAHYRAAEALAPADPTPRLRRALAVPVVYASAGHVRAARAQLEAEVAELLRDARAGALALQELNQMTMPGTFYIVYQGYNDARVMKDIQDLYATMYPPLGEVKVDTQPWDGKRKIRVGFVSAYFREHSICKLICGIIHNLDRDLFEVVVFSSTPQEDSWTEYVAEGAELVRVRTPLVANRHLVTRRRLDVLVYPDLGMDGPTTVWAHARLAPLQACFWGHPVTNGLQHMDYFISSDLFEPHHEAQQRFNEQLIRMSTLSYYFFRRNDTVMNGTLSKIPEPLSNEAGRLEDIESIKVEFGLQHCQRVFTSPQSLMKFSPDFDRVIEGILEGDQFACVVLLHDPRKGAWTKALQARQAGTVRAFARVIFLPTMPTEDFWRLLQASDLLLDPFPFGGGVTTLEAFAHCKAVLTAPGLQSVPALAGGMIRAANLAVLGSLYVGLSFKDLGLQQQQGQENGISQSIENNNHSSENDSGRKAERHAAHHQFTSEISNLHLVEEMVNTALSIGFNQTLRGEMERAVCSFQMEMAVFENNLVIQEWERMLLGMVKSSHTQ